MKRNSQFSAREVASWMADEFNRNKALFHDIAVNGIHERFGTDFTTLTHDGNYKIDHDVLLEFAALTGSDSIWVPYRNYWRARKPDDTPARVQPKKQKPRKPWS